MADVSATYLARDVLYASTAEAKLEAADILNAFWQKSQIVGSACHSLPDMPARPKHPTLVAPADVPRRRIGSDAGKAALLHAVAHIELNAIDLAADMIARFSNASVLKEKDRVEFVSDWVKICREEAYHFSLLSQRLLDLGYVYGDFPAHNGLWEAAQNTSHDMSARLAIAPMVLEARGLDVTPGMIKKFKAIGDVKTVEVLTQIYHDEIGHVRTGVKWFAYVCQNMNKDQFDYFRELLELYFKGRMKPPFNQEARALAGLPEHFYGDYEKIE